MVVNGYVMDYNQFLIYNDNGEILFKTERPYELNLRIDVNIRNARKLSFNKKDCFEIKTSANNRYLRRSGTDLYIHNSIIDVIKVEENKHFEANGETCYKDVYTLKLNYLNGEEIKVESDYYTRTEKTEERLYRERLAEIISECMYDNKSISHFEVEKLLEKVDIIIKE